ncbi:hypothetical protein CN918_28575 [Priestia megaterium]|nr:hypothetical protein CN918_28575 [Priestia megaterium]
MKPIQILKWPLLTLAVVVIGLALYFYFANQPHLTGTSSSGTWKAQYERNDRYWEGKLTQLTKKNTSLLKFYIYENGKRYDYSPTKKEQTHSTFSFMWLGDRPDKNISYKAQVTWKDAKGMHTEEFLLSRSYNPFK